MMAKDFTIDINVGKPSATLSIDNEAITLPLPLDSGAYKSLIGREYIWEPRSVKAYQRVKVIQIKWNGEEYWIETENVPGRQKYWNELSRFFEAVSIGKDVIKAVSGDALHEGVIAYKEAE